MSTLISDKRERFRIEIRRQTLQNEFIKKRGHNLFNFYIQEAHSNQLKINHSLIQEFLSLKTINNTLEFWQLICLILKQIEFSQLKILFDIAANDIQQQELNYYIVNFINISLKLFPNCVNRLLMILFKGKQWHNDYLNKGTQLSICLILVETIFSICTIIQPKDYKDFVTKELINALLNNLQRDENNIIKTLKLFQYIFKEDDTQKTQCLCLDNIVQLFKKWNRSLLITIEVLNIFNLLFCQQIVVTQIVQHYNLISIFLDILKEDTNLTQKSFECLIKYLEILPDEALLRIIIYTNFRIVLDKHSHSNNKKVRKIVERLEAQFYD